MKQHLSLSESDKQLLTDSLSKGSLKASKYKRAIALQLLDSGKTLVEVVEVIKCTYPTVLSWKKKYLKVGLSFLDDEPRSGRPILINGLQRAKITALACSEAPEGHSEWSLRLLAERAVELAYCEHISHTEVSTILKKKMADSKSQASLESLLVYRSNRRIISC
jgi:putative transposase